MGKLGTVLEFGEIIVDKFFLVIHLEKKNTEKIYNLKGYTEVERKEKKKRKKID